MIGIHGGLSHCFCLKNTFSICTFKVILKLKQLGIIMKNDVQAVESF
tara:strand:- start:407 stop:547 length:141 start_codon:yes stop_codon:yes gene_type:complete